MTEAESVGISQPTLSRLARNGVVIRLGEGLYAHADQQIIDPSVFQWIVACTRFGPKALIGGMTSLFHYNLIPQVPSKVWVIVPPNQKSTIQLYRCLRSIHDPNVEVHEQGLYRIATLERSIVEAFTYKTKIGLGTAITAGRRAISDHLTDEKRLYSAAEALGLTGAIEKYWEAIRDERFD